MSKEEAESLARHVRSLTTDVTTVREDDEGAVVEVQTARGLFTLRDEMDWEWLRPQILGTGTN
jgi:hypothetical protein